MLLRYCNFLKGFPVNTFLANQFCGDVITMSGPIEKEAPLETIIEIDPFNLHELVEDIDRRAFKILMDDFPAVVPPEALDKIRGDLLLEVNTLVGEMLNDIFALQQQLGIDDIINPQKRIFTLAEVAEQMSIVYSQPKITGDDEVDREARKRWCVAQVNWVIYSWIQVYGNLVKRLSGTIPMTVQAVIDTGTEDKLVSVPRPLEIDIAMNTWQMVKRLVLEYFQKKADSLRACGENALNISINLQDRNDRLLQNAREAFWHNEFHTAVLLLQAFRDAFLKVLQLRDPDCPIDLRDLPTAQLPSLAQQAGVSLPFDFAFLTRIAMQLETCQAACGTMPVSVLYPAYRIVEVIVENLLGLPADPGVKQKVFDILVRTMEGNHDDQAETHDQRD
jgi:hypothetical protein